MIEPTPSTSKCRLKRHLENNEVNQSDRLSKRMCMEQRSMVFKLDSKTLDEEKFISDVNNMLKFSVDLESIEKLCSSEQFNQLQQNTTQMIASLTSQPLIGLMEEEKLLLLLEFLLKLHKSEKPNNDLKFQEKSKTWSVTQLKKFLCFPLTVLKEKNYIHPMTLQTAVTKLVSVIANEICIDRKLKIPTEIIHILCLMSNIMVKMPIRPSKIFIESVISILYETNLELPIIKETVQYIGSYIFEGKHEINAKFLGQFYLLHPLSLEESVLNLLKEKKYNSNFKMNESKLPEVASYHPILFQKIINMFVSAWCETKGNKEITELLSIFVNSIQNYNSELISLFPENLSSLILLLQIPATDIPFHLQDSQAHSINFILNELIKKKICPIQDIIVLLLIFPSWFTVLHNKEMVSVIQGHLV